MRSEILPQSFCDELAKLRADADPMPYQIVVDTLTQEYGRPIDEVFARIDPTPLVPHPSRRCIAPRWSPAKTSP